MMDSKSSQDDLQRLRQEYEDREHRLAGSDLYSHFNPAHLFMTQQRQRATLKLLRANGFYPLSAKRILEVGCGRGGILLEYLAHAADPLKLHGTDLLFDRVQDARDKLPHLKLSCSDGQYLPYQGSSFDLVMQYTVFSSILSDSIKQNIAREMVRVTKPGGAILWYDFWVNPSNPQTRGISPTEIHQLFSDCRIELRKVTLAPPISRRLVPTSWLLCAFLEKLTLFNTHYLALIQPVQVNVE